MIQIRNFLILATGVFLGVGIATSQGVWARKDATQAVPYEKLQSFVEIMNRVKADYVEEVSDEELLDNAIRGMLAGLDPHSAFLEADEFREMTISTTGKFGGLGIEVQMQNGWVRVVAPIDDTPAAKAGIQPGDFIIKIDDTPVKGMNLTDAVKRMRGEPGSKIRITVISEGKPPREIELTRAVINVASVRSRMIEPGIGYLRISQFSSTTGRSLIDEVDKLRQQAQGELKGLILDLRNNPGGVLNAAIQVSDAFLDKGTIVSIKGRDAGSAREFNAAPGDVLNGRPLVVMVNGGSASASEIVAGALQDHRRGVLIGSKTFGKGSVQTILPMRDETAIKLTTARYYTPSGRSIQAAGIEPDIAIRPVEVKRIDKENPIAISEADLENRLDGDGSADQSEAEAARKRAEAAARIAESDYALYESLNLLKGLIVISGGS